jgi:hypothetical protein
MNVIAMIPLIAFFLCMWVVVCAAVLLAWRLGSGRRMWLAAAMLLALTGASQAADTVTSGTLTVTRQELRGMQIYTLDWTSDADGNVVATIDGPEGFIQRVTTKPDAGDTQPDDAYDATLSDELSVDVLGGAGANLSESSSKTWFPIVAGSDAEATHTLMTSGPLSLAITNAGASKSGIVRMWVKP